MGGVFALLGLFFALILLFFPIYLEGSIYYQPKDKKLGVVVYIFKKIKSAKKSLKMSVKILVFY